MKALLQVMITATDTRWAKEVRLFGIPIFHRKELDFQTHSKPIGFHRNDGGASKDIKIENEDVTDNTRPSD